RRLPLPLAAGAVCPCCGQAAPRTKKSVSLNADLKQVSRGGKRVRLTPDRFAIFEAVFDCYPRLATSDFIHHRAYDRRPREREPHPASVKVQVCQLRRLLAPLKLSIVAEYGRGYRLEIDR